MKKISFVGLAWPVSIRASIATGLVFFAVAAALFPIAHTDAQVTLPFYYTYNSAGTLQQATSPTQSTSPYLWLKSGAKLSIGNGVGSSIAGALPASDPWRAIYAKSNPIATDNGSHPQNVFLMYSKVSIQNVAVHIYVDRLTDNLANIANRHAYNSESLIARYQNDNNFYVAGVRADGMVVIKKKAGGTYTTLATGRLFPGTFDAATNPDLMPQNTWIGLKLMIADNASGTPVLSLYTDIGWSGTWKLTLTAEDTSGTAITAPGLAGLESDFADIKLDNFTLEDVGTPASSLASTSAPASGAAAPSSATYDSVVLASSPALYLAMNSPSSGKETDLSGNGHSGTYLGGTPALVNMPNGDKAANLNGSTEYLSVPSSPAFSIPTTGKLTWEAWVRPTTLQSPNASSDGYVSWMGKCYQYSPSCEWEARFYSLTTAENRPNRFSAYVFNPSAGLGAGADWQPASGIVQAGAWQHVVAEYDMSATPSGCSSSYPGTINIWVDGIKQNFADHAPTGCMSQFSVSPKAGNSPLNIGSMAMDSFFQGAIGKVAIYDRLLSQTEISNHFKAMSGSDPTGSCGVTCTTSTTGL